MSHAVVALLDAFLVTFITYPVLYRYVVRPMNQHIAERQQVEAALRRAHDDLELRVNERTAELAQANESLQVQIVERQRAGDDLKAALDLVQQRQAEMAGLLSGARAVLEFRNFAEMAQAIFEACRSTIGAAAGYVALPTEDQSHEKPVFSNMDGRAGTLDVFLPMPIVGLRQQAYATGKTLYLNDPDSDEYAQLLLGGHLPLSSVLLAPMMIKGFVVGALGLANKPGGFSDDDARLAAAFAELAAIAVLNSRTIELLESSERRFRTLAQATFEGIVISEEEIIREANEQFARMHGYALSEVIGRPISSFITPQDHERMQQAIAGDEKHLGEYCALRKDGSIFPLEVQAYRSDQYGRSLRVAALRDITARKQAEDAIRAQNALLSSIIESPDSAIFSIDCEYRYTSFNRQHARVMQALFGAEIEIGRNLLDYHTVAVDRESAKQHLDRALAGESFVIEDWAGDDALTRRCFEISHNPVKDADRIIGASVFAQDITERKFADQVLRENEEWLRLAFDAGDLGRWRYAVATGMVHFDERGRLHSGSNDNLVSQAEALTRVHPDDRARLQQEIADALDPASHGRYATEYRVVWPDGETHWLAVQARVHFEGEGEARQPVLAVGISQDITARKQAEKELRESRARLNFALENSGTGGWDLDLVDHTAFRTLEHDRIFGYESLLPEWTYEMFLDHVIPEDRAEVDRRFQAAMKEQTNWNFECRIRRADGEVRWIWAVGGHQYDETHQAYRMAGIVQDITERKRAGEALRESEERFRLALKNAPVSVAAQDRDLRFLWAYNQRTVDPASVIGKTDNDVFPPEDAARLIALKRAVLATNTERREQLWLTSGGQRVFIDLYLEPMRDASGQVTGIGIATVDLTQMKLAEEALRLSRSDLDRAQEVGQIGSWRLDVRRNVLTWSDENHRIFGVPPGTPMTYDTFLGSVHPDDREYVDRRWAAGLAGEPYDIEHRIIANGSLKWVRERAYLEFDQEGDILGGFGITQDITAHKQAEESLRRQAALLDLSPDAIIVLSPDGIITFWSQGAEALYGWKEHEALGKPVSALLQHQLPEPIEQIVEQLKQTGRWTGEIIHHTRGGTKAIVQSWWLAQFDARGNITEVFESNVDITVRKQMEEQLRHAAILLEGRVLERTAELAAANNALRLQSAALQAAANGIVITDRQGNIQWTNPALAEMTGYAAEEVLGLSTRVFSSGLKEPEFYHDLWETILSGQVWRGELINRRKDGSLYVEEQTIAPVLNEHGEIANFVAVKQDVTERREEQSRLEQNNRDLLALSKAEHEQRQLAETLSDASLALTQSLDLEAVMETLLDYVSRLVPYDSANVMLLETEERLVIRAARGYEKWTDSQQTRAITFDARSNQILRQLISTQKSVLIPETNAQPDWQSRPGAEHVRSWIGVPIIAGGKVIGIYSLDKTLPDFFTIEHVRLAEALVGQAAIAIQNAWLFDQLRAGRERLQSLSRRLVEVQEAERHYVARELHDEAGQALTSLVYGLGELERETDPDRRLRRLTELKETTHEVLENLHRLAMDLRPASLDFLGLVPALNQYLKETGERHGLNAQFKVVGLTDERLPAALETALYRIVQEALTNVIRHAQATRIDVLLEQRDGELVLVVEDNGRGFEADPARQAQTGHLGLIGMQERAEMLGGTLVIESSPGSGTTIVIEVPYAHSNSHRR